MPPNEYRHMVLLGQHKVGRLVQRGDYTQFFFDNDYLDDPNRPVLGLNFEQDLTARHAASLRLPPWFSNLLPENRLREWIAADRGVSPQREMQLLAQVGGDLPGAVRVIEDTSDRANVDWTANEQEGVVTQHDATEPWRFSLAGVAFKFSMLKQGDRLTLPAYGSGGDWIVKFPDAVYPDVPRNEFTMMTLARRLGIEVPEIRLVQRDEIEGVPAEAWPNREQWAYAIRRFDRGEDRERVHIEDLAQVRGFYPEAKYSGNYESIASLTFRGFDTRALIEFTRRLTLNILVSNGDAHLKNWSLIYLDPRVPTLSPAYDIVATRPYMGSGEESGLKFSGTRRFEMFRLGAFDRLDARLGADAGLADVAREVLGKVSSAWEDVRGLLENNSLAASIKDSIDDRLKSLQVGSH